MNAPESVNCEPRRLHAACLAYLRPISHHHVTPWRVWRTGSGLLCLPAPPQNKFDWRSLGVGEGDKMLISYGPCQFPTLGLIVQRAW